MTQESAAKVFDFSNTPAPRPFYDSPVCTAWKIELNAAFKASADRA